MYTFEGQFRRIPQQNLAGASKIPQRSELLEKLHNDRLQREEERKRVMKATRMQACIRGFLVKRRLKHKSREMFDKLANLDLKDYSSKSVLGSDEDPITIMLTKLVYFFEPKDDMSRLKYLCTCLMSVKVEAVKLIADDVLWRLKFKKVLRYALDIMDDMEPTEHGIGIQMLQTFMSQDLFEQICGKHVAVFVLTEMYHYMLTNDFYRKIRRILDGKLSIPSVLLSGSACKFATIIIRLIEQPLKLLTKTDNAELSTLTYKNLMIYYLHARYSQHVQLCVLPFLKKCKFFSYDRFVSVSYQCQMSEEKLPRSSWLLSSLLFLQPAGFYTLCAVGQFCNFLQVIAYHTPCFYKIHIRNLENETTAAQTEPADDDFDDEDEVDSDIENDQNDRIDCESQPINPIPLAIESAAASDNDEISLLEHSLNEWNEPSSVDELVTRLKRFKIDEKRHELSAINSLSKISYYLLALNNNGLFEYRFLHTLYNQPKFIRGMLTLIQSLPESSSSWHSSAAVTACQQQSSSSSTYLSALSNAEELPFTEIKCFIPLLTTFCIMFSQLMNTFDDSEFARRDNIKDDHKKTAMMPFSLNELSELCQSFKNLCIGLIELSLPDCKLARKKIAQEFVAVENDNHMYSLEMWMRLFQSVVVLVKKLYERDLRVPFCPENCWVSSRIGIIRLDNKSPDFNILTSLVQNRNNFAPFTSSNIRNRTELLKNGPPLTNREMRLMTVIRSLPFLLSFQDRMGVFRNYLKKDKLAQQGEQPYVFFTKSISIIARRNYLYEDAFEKLSPKNASDLRLVIRVQLRNVAGLDEPGVDGGGLFREFLTEVLKTSFDPNRGFFKLTTDNQLYPNPFADQLHDNVYEHYFFIGRMLGKAIYENLLVELPLAEFFLSTLASGSDIALNHLASLDPVLHKGLIYLKNFDGDATTLGLDFTLGFDDGLGRTRRIDLKAGGANIPVTNANKLEYIHLVADYKLNKQILSQSMAFKKGIADVVKPNWLNIFNYKELQIIISGASMPVDVNDLRKHTKYNGGYSDDHPTIQLFWRIMQDFDDSERKLLLKFVTSCSRQPLFGFKNLIPQFCIQKSLGDRLPTSSTCMNLLKIPDCRDYDVLKKKIMYAIKAGAGFELS